MISKVFITAQGFGQTCRYVCEELDQSEEKKQIQEQRQEKLQVLQKIQAPQKARVLAVEGVRGHNYRLMAADFERQHQFLPEKEKPVFHGMLSFPPGEDPGDEKMVAIAREYLQEIGMKHTQYAIVKHTNREHLHLHIVANRVDNDGAIIGKGLIIERGIKAAQKLTREYNLTPEQSKRLEYTHRESLHEPDAYRYRLYEAITRELSDCHNLDDLERRLLTQGISTRYRQDRETGQRQGISFRIEKYCFQGKQVDPSFSLRRLEQTLELQQQSRLEQKLKQQQELKPDPEEELAQRLRHYHHHSL